MMVLMRILILTVFVVTKVFGEMDCEKDLFLSCPLPKMMKEVPRKLPEFNDQCPKFKSYLMCLKEFQDSCENEVTFQSSDTYEGAIESISSLCEEGTLLNTVATENLECLNDTLSKTNCRMEAHMVTKSYLEKEGTENVSVNLLCAQEVYVYECLKAATSQSCGEKVEEAASLFIRQAKLLENYCGLEGAKSVLEKMDELDLKEDRRNSMTESLEEFVQRMNDSESR